MLSNIFSVKIIQLISVPRPFCMYYLVQYKYSWVFFQNLSLYIQERSATYFTLYLGLKKPATTATTCTKRLQRAKQRRRMSFEFLKFHKRHHEKVSMKSYLLVLVRYRWFQKIHPVYFWSLDFHDNLAQMGKISS